MLTCGDCLGMARLTCASFAAALVVAPLGAKSADLIVWQEKGVNPEEDEAAPRAGDWQTGAGAAFIGRRSFRS